MVSYIDGLVQDCSISIALAMEILQSCSKPSMHKAKLSSRYWTVVVINKQRYDTVTFAQQSLKHGWCNHEQHQVSDTRLMFLTVG